MNEDDKLIKKVASGDTKAFNQLFNKYGGIVLGYCGKYLDKAEAEEVSQEVWMKLIRASQSYQPQGKALNWIYTISRNLCFSKYNGSHDFPLDETILLTEFESQEVSLIKEEELKMLLDRVEHLPLPQKTAIMMFYMEEKTLEEIGQFLNMKPNAVKVLLFRSRNTLRKESSHGQTQPTK